MQPTLKLTALWRRQPLKAVGDGERAGRVGDVRLHRGKSPARQPGPLPRECLVSHIFLGRLGASIGSGNRCSAADSEKFLHRQPLQQAPLRTADACSADACAADKSAAGREPTRR